MSRDRGYLVDAVDPSTLGDACAEVGGQLKAHLRAKRIAIAEEGGPLRRAHRMGDGRRKRTVAA